MKPSELPAVLFPSAHAGRGARRAGGRRRMALLWQLPVLVLAAAGLAAVLWPLLREQLAGR